MPYRYTIDVAAKRVHSHGWGDLSDADLLGHQEQVAQNPDFRPYFSQLLDLVGVDSAAFLTGSGIMKAAQLHQYGPGSRRAIVVASTEMFGLAQAFQAYRDQAGGQEQIRVFKSMQHAMVWLLEYELEI